MKNYYNHSFYLALSTFVLLAALWFVPGGEVRGVEIRRVNIVGDVWGDSVIRAALGDPYWAGGGVMQNPDAVAEEGSEQVEEPIVYYVEANGLRGGVSVIRGAVPEGVKLGPEARAVVKFYNAGADPEQIKKEEAHELAEVHTDSAKGAPEVENNDPVVTAKVKPTSVATTGTATAPAEEKKSTAAVVPTEGAKTHEGVTPIEGAANPLFRNFLAKMRGGKRLRIAVCGDSFIEGDIFTQDLREQLQKRYGGGGVGYVPITSQVAGFRQSVGHSFSGWTTRSALNGARGEFLLSGYTFTPSEGAWVTYRGSKARAKLGAFECATLVFVNRGDTEIVATVNDSIVSVFRPESSEGLQSVTVNGVAGGIKSVRFKVSRVQGFTAYGALLDESSGVSVDNFSIRSYSGAALASISAAKARQASAIAPYDMIILEYGLNVAAAQVLKYDQYANQMVRIIENLQAAYPGVAIMVMSISDRQNRTGGSWTTMPGVVAMERTQRGVANRCGVSFWSTMKAMQSLGGMNHFVQKGWAAKDYTHLSSSGGRVVATEFVKALDNTK